MGGHSNPYTEWQALTPLTPLASWNDCLGFLPWFLVLRTELDRFLELTHPCSHVPILRKIKVAESKAGRQLDYDSPDYTPDWWDTPRWPQCIRHPYK